MRKEPLVRECWMLSGEIDFVLKCVAPDLKTFQAFVAELTGGAARAQRQDLADAAQLQGRRHGADGVEGEDLKGLPNAWRVNRHSNAGMTSLANSSTERSDSASVMSPNTICGTK